MHDIQKLILRNLLFKEGARFSELNSKGVSNDHFTFHIKKLLEANLVEKNKDGFYHLTDSGKEYANRLNTDIVEIERQAKTAILVVCVDDSGSNRNYLFQQRLKHPYYGFHGFVSGKIQWGETIYEAGARELMEETGLSANLELAGIEHKIDYSQDGKLLEDKYFYIMKANRPTGELMDDFEGGKNVWMEKGQLREIPEVFQDVPKIMEVVDAGKIHFFEKRYTVKRY